MRQQVLEGTWEEMVQRASELAGRRVRLTILDGEAGGATEEPPTLDQTLAGRCGRLNFAPANLSENAEEAFGALVAAKFRQQGLSV